MDNTHHVNPIVNTLLVSITILYSAFANVFHHADLVLSIITKIIPIVSFALFLVINYKTIGKNSTEIWRKWRNIIKEFLRKKLKKNKP